MGERLAVIDIIAETLTVLDNPGCVSAARHFLLMPTWYERRHSPIDTTRTAKP